MYVSRAIHTRNMSIMIDTSSTFCQDMRNCRGLRDGIVVIVMIISRKSIMDDLQGNIKLRGTSCSSLVTMATAEECILFLYSLYSHQVFHFVRSDWMHFAVLMATYINSPESIISM